MTITDGLRVLVTKLGGTPSANTIKGLISEAIVAAGETPSGHSTSERVAEYANTTGSDSNGE
jgi:hypothetical protein